MIVDNLLRIELKKGYFDLTDDRISVINGGEPITIMKYDIISVELEEYNVKTKSNNIRIGTRLGKNTYASKSFDIGSRECKRGDLWIGYNDNGSKSI